MGASLIERKAGRLSPIATLLECDQCSRRYDPSTNNHLAYMWECLDRQCGAWFDCLWLIEELSWSPKVDYGYEAEFREEKPLNERFNPDFYPRLCCDRPFNDCKCDGYYQIAEDDVSDFLTFNKIDIDQVYERGSNECVTCEYYASNGCLPLRGMLRFYDYVQILPFFALTGCSNFTPSSYVDPVDLITRTHQLEYPARRSNDPTNS